jgi:hypothetical protein
MGHKNFLTKAKGGSSLLRAAGRSEWTREKNGSLTEQKEQLERKEVEMVEIELRVRKEKNFVGEPLLCWEDED